MPASLDYEQQWKYMVGAKSDFSHVRGDIAHLYWINLLYIAEGMKFKATLGPILSVLRLNSTFQWTFSIQLNLSFCNYLKKPY